ncbi:MAG: hypothetical protein ACNYZH_09960 [Acidimicrobiia bacterium]
MGDVHVLLVYSLGEQKHLSVREFPSSERDSAYAAYEAAEEDHRNREDVEIVLVAADSLETIRHTHGSYFRENGRALDLALESLLARQ